MISVGVDTGNLYCFGNPLPGYGRYGKLRDGDGYTYIYGHTNGFDVATGAEVAEAARIGRMGSTGCSSGSHLHLTVVGPDGLDRNPFDRLRRP